MSGIQKMDNSLKFKYLLIDKSPNGFIKTF